MRSPLLDLMFGSHVLFTVFDSILIVITLLYVYYWYTVFHAKMDNHISREVIGEKDITNLLAKARRKNEPYRFLIQITTKGGVKDVIVRGIDNVLQSVKKYPILQKIVFIEIVTEDLVEAEFLNNKYAHAPICVTAYLLPPTYKTAYNTRLKARALHFMVEMHRQKPTEQCYVVHYDEESVYTPDNLARLVYNLLKNPVELSEGTISYGLDWKRATIMCRAIESNRPFGCHECYYVMTSPPAYHLHGSNLVINQKLENEIGWDIGTYEGNALIAEDLVFGLLAYIQYGPTSFGWHRVEMIEQPPFTLKAAMKQRERWVFGAIQAVKHIQGLPEWSQLDTWSRIKIVSVIYLRILSYAAGFPISIISLLINTFLITQFIKLLLLQQADLYFNSLSILLLPGMLMWIGGIQLGLFHNLRYSELTKLQKV